MDSFIGSCGAILEVSSPEKKDFCLSRRYGILTLTKRGGFKVQSSYLLIPGINHQLITTAPPEKS